MAIDPALPRGFVRNFFESNPSYRPGVNEETDALFNPSIEAKPMHAPMAMRGKPLRDGLHFHWAFDRCGQNPNHTRVEQLRHEGWQYATTNDIDMFVKSVVMGKDEKGFSNEIRNGDNRLMMISKKRWLEIQKAYLTQAIMMTNPRGKVMGEEGTVMGVSELLPGIKTITTEQPDGLLKAAVAFSNASEDIGRIRENKSPQGNASKVSRESISRGARMRPSAGRGE